MKIKKIHCTRNELIGKKTDCQEANEFARELMMPEKEFVKKWTGYNLMEVCDYFYAPLSEVIKRAKELGLCD